MAEYWWELQQKLRAEAEKARRRRERRERFKRTFTDTWGRINWAAVAGLSIMIASSAFVVCVCMFVFDRIAFWFFADKICK